MVNPEITQEIIDEVFKNVPAIVIEAPADMNAKAYIFEVIRAYDKAKSNIAEGEQKTDCNAQ